MIEKGEQRVHAHLLVRFATALAVSANELLGLVETSPPPPAGTTLPRSAPARRWVMAGLTRTVVVAANDADEEEDAHGDRGEDQGGGPIDQAFKFRDRNSSRAIDPQEIDANRFAAELLMPKDEVLGAVEAEELDLNDDQAVRRLAKHFGVSQQALMIRLGTLRVYVDGAANI